MGHLDVVPIVARGINIYVPMLIVLLCLSTYFRLGARVLHTIGVDQFIDDDDEMTAEMVQSGRALVGLGMLQSRARARAFLQPFYSDCLDV